MSNQKPVLEHEILAALYLKGKITYTAAGTKVEGHCPLYKDDISTCVFELGYLVDLLNNPDKYVNRVIEENNLFNEIRVKWEDVKITKYSWQEVSDAIEILLYNEHVSVMMQYEQDLPKYRTITLLKKGAIDYKKKFYLEEAQKENYNDIIRRLTEIDVDVKELTRQNLKAEAWPKKYWWLIALVTLVISGIFSPIVSELLKRNIWENSAYLNQPTVPKDTLTNSTREY
jgi:hypothetical protein